MATKPCVNISKKLDEHDFDSLDAFAKNLKLEEGQTLSAKELLDHSRARRVRGRPTKLPGERAGRYMVSMEPALHEAAVRFSRKSKMSLSGLIAIALAERIDFRV